MARQTFLDSDLRDPRLLGTDVPAPSRYDGGLDVNLGHAGSCSGSQQVNWSVFDNSGSMGHGNDPIGNRFDEVRYTLHHLARYCRCGKELSAIVHFDTPTSGDVMPAKLDRKGLTQLEAGLAIPPDGAGISMLGPSLEVVTAMALKHQDYRHVLTVLSDFELFDPPGTLDQLIEFPGDVHAVVFRARPPRDLIDAPNVLVTRVQPTDPPGAVAEAVFASMTMHRKVRRHRRFAKKEAKTW